MAEPTKRTLRVYGRTENFEGVLNYTTVVNHGETDQQAAERATNEYFMFRQGILDRFEEIDPIPEVKTIGSTDGFDTSNTEPNETVD